MVEVIDIWYPTTLSLLGYHKCAFLSTWDELLQLATSKHIEEALFLSAASRVEAHIVYWGN